MTLFPKRSVVLLGLGLFSSLLTSGPEQLRAQASWLTPFSLKDTQRNALNQVRGQVKWLQNATRTASRSPVGGYDLLGQRYQTVCAAYGAFKRTLTPPQWIRRLTDSPNWMPGWASSEKLSASARRKWPGVDPAPWL
jgi:hypothetical protein